MKTYTLKLENSGMNSIFIPTSPDPTLPPLYSVSVPYAELPVEVQEIIGSVGFDGRPRQSCSIFSKRQPQLVFDVKQSTRFEIVMHDCVMRCISVNRLFHDIPMEIAFVPYDAPRTFIKRLELLAVQFDVADLENRFKILNQLDRS